ncbi:MAG TPA: tetratricopeptide repeat protein [Bacteroidetes bacterium]|nr:tetratricopeptide repeat protein [Bacteroidota bacterium]
MKKHLCVLIIIIVLPLMNLSGQETLQVSRSDFKAADEGFRDAWKSLKEGDKLFKAGVGMYPQAVICYLLASDYNSNNAELNYKIGLAYLLGREPVKSLDFFLRAYELNPDVAEDILLLTGKSYHLRGDYGKAIDYYNMYSDRFHESGTFRPEVNKLVNQCNKAIEMSANEVDTELINAGGNVNSEYDDYSPVLTNEGRLLYFTTRRIIDKKRKRQNSDMKWDENIFVATGEHNKWNPAGPAGDNLASPLNEGVLAVDAPGELMYIYAGYTGNGDILLSEYEDGEWSSPHKPGINCNTRYRETSISITEDNNEIFFTSDMGKGLGGRDIYYITRVGKNKWTEPFNLGNPVNSELNEESVHVSPGGDTIWFSSNRPGGIGGYDIYMSVKDEVGLWSEPFNLGLPVNSQSNDMFYRPGVFYGDESWLASDRPGGYGGFDIYRLVLKRTTGVPQKANNDSLSVTRNATALKPDTLMIRR